MACLNLTNGSFSRVTGWSSANTGSSGDGNVQINRSTANLVVSKAGSASLFYGQDSLFMTFGNSYVLILHKQSDVVGITRSVAIVDSTGSSLQSEIVVSLYSTASSVGDPIVYFSAGNGAACMIVTPRDGTNQRNLHGFFRTDTGQIIANLGFAQATQPGSIEARIDSGSFQAFYNMSWVTAGPIPEENCNVSPNSQTFNDAVIGPGVDPSLSTNREQFTIQNTGGDCLNINSITNSSPFNVIGTSEPLPAILDPSQSLTVEVEFAPTGIGNFSESLAINPTPSNGDTHLICSGESRPPELSISFASSIDFMKVPVTTSVNRTVNITNNGEAPVALNISASPPDIPFSWVATPPGLTLATGQVHPLVITFNPPAMEASHSHTLNFNSGDPDSPHLIHMQGIGCIANAEMQITVPPGPFIDFDNIQRGFRSVRIIKIANNGDGPLNVSVRIEGTDASLFGIQRDGGSITSPLSNTSFTVLPLDPCGGSAGAGEVVFGITFYANDVPRIAQSQLVIYNHNATNGLTPEIRFDLQAEIIQAIALDAELVLDRSGSMADPSGARIKSQTAIDAARLFVEMMRPNVEDRLGVVRFNATPEVIPGLSIQNITSGSQGTISSNINNTTLNPSGATSIAGGIRVAIKDIDDNPRATPPPELNTSIIVLTDGFDNTSYNDPDGNTYSLLGGDGATALPTPTDKKIFAVGIGDSIDNGRLSILAQASGGEFLSVRDFSGTDYFQLEKYFTQIFMESVDLSIIHDPVYTINPGEQHTTSFDILRGDTGFMIVVYDREFIRLPFYLESPIGETIDITSIPTGFQVRPGITSTARFLEVKFPENEPNRYAGQWKFIIKHDGRACYFRPNEKQNVKLKEMIVFEENSFTSGFTTQQCKEDYTEPIMYGLALGAGSNFRMFPFVQPGIIKVGEPIKLNAIIQEFGLPVKGCAVTVKAKTPSGAIYNFNLFDDGSHVDGDADDGDYGKQFTQTNEEGFYTFTYNATGYSRDGEPIFREAVRSKYIEGTTPLVPPQSEIPGTNGKPTSLFKECCKRIGYLLLVIIILLLLLLILKWRG